jgi:DNA-binding response OmpR family regulator
MDERIPAGTVNSGTSLLVVEDDDSIRQTLVEAFELDGYRALGAADLDSARELLGQGVCDVALLDINLPDGCGYDLLRELRSGEIRVDGRSLEQLPVVLVSGRGGEYDRIRGFECGCDDYVTKPYSFGELRGRLAAVMRRQYHRPVAQLIDLGELRIDTHRRHVELGGRPIVLTHKEYSLLIVLASDPERVFERDQLLAEIWGYNASSTTRTLDAHACRLRTKLAGGHRRYVENSWGVGYRLCGLREGA